MSDANDQSQDQKTKKTIMFIIGIIALFAVVVLITVFALKRFYPSNETAPEGEAGEEPAAELVQDSPENSSLAPSKHEKAASTLRESASKKDISSFAVQEGKGSDLSFSGLSNSNKSKKSDLKEAANDMKTDMLVNMGNIQ